MFGNWLNRINKKDKTRIRIDVLALCWSMWTCKNMIVFEQTETRLFAGDLASGTLDISMVFASPGGSAGAYDYWLQSAAHDHSRLLFLGWRHISGFKMYSFLLFFIFCCLIHISCTLSVYKYKMF
jgi:hypothetical protein